MTPVLTSVLLVMVLGTPKEWLDPRLDLIDREAIEEMITFAVPPIANDVEWVLVEDTQPPEWTDFLGKVLVIQTWSNQSASGRVAPIAAQRVVDSFEQKEKIALVTIHTPQGANKAKKFISKRKITAPTAIDTSGTTCNMLGVFYDPVSIVVDKNGAVRHIGLRTRGLTKAIEELVGEEYNPKVIVKPFVPKADKNEVTTPFPPHAESFGVATNIQGKRAPTFSVEQWISEPVEVENRVRVVEFWATWCPPCVKSIPHLNELKKHFGEKVAFVGVSSESVEKVKSFMKKNKMNYGVAVDNGRKMQSAINCKGIPLAMLISSDNIVRWQGNPSRLTQSIIEQVISADSKETEVADRGRWKPKKAKPRK
ncbi:MAG: TlpA family protein disulfide reductase [Phycisphaerales bacterium]|nr:TlpA family protein disulfide reductase [Phycisphaerales bacterium]